MTLASGSRLGPYEIAERIGAGGMGEVWRALDTRLGREVAIKVLPAALSSDAERMRRFEKEARAASSLNHPAIVTIYEVGQAGDVTYLAMELVVGATLRELLEPGPLPLRRMLGIAAQVADGLAKAHASGIVHRDLKPENIMVSKDGFAKILDFGLAKLTAPDTAGPETKAATVSAGTEPGVVMGTVGYMSPEQARGAGMDFRSDQFSLGSVLYEMATGRRAFSGETKPEILAAIIREDPQPVAALNARVPAPVRWIIERCLAKDPAERYASTEDLARDLKSADAHLSEISASSVGAGVSGARRPPVRSRRLFEIAAGVIAGLALGVFGFRMAAARSARPSAVASFQRVTFQRGNVLNARFAPDGQTILYSASWEGRPTEIFSTRIDGTESRPLGLSKADLAAVSSSGELLLLLKSAGLRSPAGTATLARASLSGGVPREVAESVHAADWLPDGEIIVQRHIAWNHDELQFPPGTRRFDYGGSAPRVSRDGRRIAISRQTPKGGEIVVLDETGRILWSAPSETNKIAWHPNGEIWYSRVVGQEPGLYALPRGRPPRPILKATGWILHDIAADGRLLMERAVARRSLRVRLAGDAKERELSWLDGSDLVDVSTERGTVVFSETREAGTRAGGVYLRATDGSPAVRLSDGTARAFSEDGRWAFVQSVGQPFRYALVPSSVGEPIPVDLRGSPLLGAKFLPGSEPRLLVSVGESTDRGHIELVAPAGPRSLGISPGFAPDSVAVSPDGGTVAYRTGPGAIALCRLDKPSCRKLAVTPEGPIQWSADGRYLYLRDFEEVPAHVFRYEIATSALTSWLTVGQDSTNAIESGNIFVSRDGRNYAFNPTEVYDSSLFVVEGLR